MKMGATFLREKKKKRNSPSLKTVGDNAVSELASQHSHGGKGSSHLSNAGHHLPQIAEVEETLMGTVLLQWRVRWMAVLDGLPGVKQTEQIYQIKPGIYCLGFRITDESHRQIWIC